ncbi:MAG: hypothetical protein HZA93_00055 [Verrucomicrobia bacterium]|nr:hypothetical protein [Verrucomicrobiota bacterium]
MTRLEVIDSAVKIGLGAMIGGVSALLLAWFNARHQTNSEIRKRRLDLLERVATEFEQTHQVVNEIYSCYGSYLDAVESGDTGRVAIAWNTVSDTFLNKSAAAFSKLVDNEGRLMLLGMTDAVKALNAYRIAATLLQNQIRHPSDGQGPLITSHSFGQLILEIVKKRSDLYSALKATYE